METRDHRLLYLFLEITRKCNLACIHCGSDCTRSVNNPELTIESWIKIIKYIRHSFGPGVFIAVTGGEPTIHPGLGIITGAIKECGFKWGIVTNGMELPESLLNVLLENRITSISVSLDGAEQTHNWLRNNKTSYRKAINSLELIGRSELEIKEAVTCVNPRNMGELEQIAGTLIEKRISRWRLLRIFPSGRAINNRDILLTFSQTRQLLDWIAEKRSYYRKKGLKISYGCEGYMPVGLDRKVRDLPFFCRAGVNYASILSDGTITGCSNNNSRFHVGNIIRDDLASLWNKDFSIFRERGWARTGFCKNCPEFNNCGGSSIHLWNESDAGPAFCYLKDASIF